MDLLYPAPNIKNHFVGVSLDFFGKHGSRIKKQFSLLGMKLI